MTAPTGRVDPALKTWATPAQMRWIDAINAHGSIKAAARALKTSDGTMRRGLESVRRKAAIHGYSPEHNMTRPVPDTHVAKGISTYYDADGVVRGQWVKSTLDDQKAEQAKQAMLAAFADEFKGLSPLVAVPASAHKDLMVVYPWGDPHFGLYTWAKECGDDFDLEIAERLTLAAVDRLVSSAPPADTALLVPLGDFFHADDQTNQTPAHRHQLDTDGRFPKVLGVGVKTLRHAVLRLLEKHRRVILRIEPGNHDPHAKWALTLTMAAYFENNPRVEVDLSPSKFWFYRFGKVLIGTTHGDTTKHEALLGVMASDRASDWGETLHRYWYTGHVHNSIVREFPGVVCESFRTLAARDAYTAGHGYRAGRDMRAIVHHREHGEIERHRCDVGMIE